MWRYVAMIFILIALGTVFYPRTEKPLPKLPEVHFTLPDGAATTLKAYEGKLVLVHFWATWCPPCIAELPELVKLAQDNPQIVILAFSADSNQATMQNYLTATFPQLPENFIAIWDDHGAVGREQFYSYSYPETYIVGCDGSLRAKQTGPASNWPRTLQPHLESCKGV